MFWPDSELLRQGLGCLRELGFRDDMGGNSKLTRKRAGDRLSEHGEVRRPRPTDALGKPLERSGERQHSGRYLDAAENRVLRSNNKVAIERQLETTTDGQTLYRGDGRNP